MPSLGEPGTPAPFHEDRPESPGEANQRRGSKIVQGLKLYLKMDLTKTEQAAVATLVGAFMRWWKGQKRK